MDYFITGEYMERSEEHPSHYSEQDTLIVGQGIWYDRLQVAPYYRDGLSHCDIASSVARSL
jgi:hypothetical protein